MRAEHHPQPDALALARLIVRRPGWLIRRDHLRMLERIFFRTVADSLARTHRRHA